MMLSPIMNSFQIGGPGWCNEVVAITPSKAEDFYIGITRQIGEFCRHLYDEPGLKEPYDKAYISLPAPPKFICHHLVARCPEWDKIAECDAIWIAYQWSKCVDDRERRDIPDPPSRHCTRLSHISPSAIGLNIPSIGQTLQGRCKIVVRRVRYISTRDRPTCRVLSEQKNTTNPISLSDPSRTSYPQKRIILVIGKPSLAA